MPSLLASDALLACFAGTLELKASKENAHRDGITSVQFAPDGKTIVSGSWDKTIKVWTRLQWSISAHDQFDAHSRGVAQRLFFVSLLLLKFVPGGIDSSGQIDVAERIVHHVCNS